MRHTLRVVGTRFGSVCSHTTLPASVDVDDDDDDDEKTNRRERAVRKRIRVCANHGCGACFVFRRERTNGLEDVKKKRRIEWI